MRNNQGPPLVRENEQKGQMFMLDIQNENLNTPPPKKKKHVNSKKKWNHLVCVLYSIFIHKQFGDLFVWKTIQPLRNLAQLSLTDQDETKWS